MFCAWEGHALRSRRSRDQGIAHDWRCVVETDAVRLAGVHHLKLPVRDIARSEAWYGRTLGYRRSLEFRDDEKLMGILMIHPEGGPPLALRLDPDRARGRCRIRLLHHRCARPGDN